MKRTPVHPINPNIKNGAVVDLYLDLIRRNRMFFFRRVMEHVLCTQIQGNLPERLHIPHPYGILTGSTSRMGEDVTLMQFCLLGPKDPWYEDTSMENQYPTLEEGVYVSPGAKVLGPVRIGAWTVIGANAVVTQDIPPFSTVFGTNRVLRQDENGPLLQKLRKLGRSIPVA
jgi:serine acetyltransferase